VQGSNNSVRRIRIDAIRVDPSGEPASREELTREQARAQGLRPRSSRVVPFSILPCYLLSLKINSDCSHSGCEGTRAFLCREYVFSFIDVSMKIYAITHAAKIRHLERSLLP